MELSELKALAGRLLREEAYYDAARMQFIVIHRVNNYAYDACIRVFDEIQKRGLIRFKAKPLYNKLDKIWHTYLNTIKKNTETDVYFLLQDNFILTTDVVRPYVDSFINAIRDYLITKGVRDTLFIAQAEASIQMLKICTDSYKTFFADIEKECGIDFSKDFMYANMEEFYTVFLQLCSFLHLITGYDVFQNNRVQSAWTKLLNTIRDDDLMDEQAEKAIHFHPTIEQKYNKEIEAIEQKKMADKMNELSDKYKVSKLK